MDRVGMWWVRILNRNPAARNGGTVRFLERVISPSESHSATPFRVIQREVPSKLIDPVEPVTGTDYRIKRPARIKQCF